MPTSAAIPFVARGDLLERVRRGLEEAGAEQQVLRGVSGDGQLGEEHEVGAALACLLEACEDALPVSVEVADDGVDLGQRQAHGMDSSGFRLEDENRAL